MAVFHVNGPNGEVYEVTAPDNATQDQVIAFAQSQAKAAPAKPKPKPNGIVDAGKSFVSGLAEGVAPIADAIVDSGPIGMIKRAAGAADVLRGAKLAPKPASVNVFADRVAKDAHQPETMGGSFARTLGQMAPNVIAPGTAAVRALNVFAPAVGSEGAGQIAHAMGASPTVETAARLVGGAAGAGAASVRAPSLPVRAAPVPKAMSVDQLRAAKTAAYQAADQAGVRYAPEAVDGLISNIAADLQKARLNPARHPKAASMLADIQKAAGGSPTLTELDQLRQVIRRDVASAPDKAEQFMGKRMIAQIDRFVDGATPNDVAAGDAQNASDLINNARDLNTRLRKVESVTGAVRSAELRAGSTGSGGNADNAMRQNLRRVLEKTPNLSHEEGAALESIVMGGKGQNLLRLVGKLSPSGNGLMAAANLGAAAVAGPLGAIPGAAGLMSKIAADRMTRMKVEGLVQLMARGGAKKTAPAARQIAAPVKAIGHNPFAGIALPAYAATLSATPAMAEAQQ